MATNEAAALTRTDLTARLHGIYLIVNEGERNAVAIARDALRAGVRIIQYRAKRGIVAENLRALRDVTRDAEALLIVNDDWRAAIDYDCDGVHLGPDDDGFVDIAPVRAAIGERLIGLSCGTVAEAEAAQRMGADYMGVGSVYATSSKGDAGDPIGIAGLRRVAAAATLPVAAIGGIDAVRLAAVRETGVAMAAVISAIVQADVPFEAACELVERWAGGVHGTTG